MINESRKFGYPVRHVRKVPFEPSLGVSAQVARWNIDILAMDRELDRYILSAEDYLELVSEAFASNIHISTSLEGNPLTKADVKKLTLGTMRRGVAEKTLDFPRQEIINHILTFQMKEFAGPWSVEHVKRIHAYLMNGDSHSAPGVFRDHAASIESSDGQELFIPAPAEYIEEELASLLAWLNRAGPSTYPVIAASVFFHEFESIHPFSDGNGRTGRTLFHLYLQHHHLKNSKLCLLEQEIVADAESYYDLLARTDFSGDYGMLIEYFSKAVLEGYRKANAHFGEKDLLGSSLDETAKRLLSKAKGHGGWFAIEEAVSWVDRTSEYIVRTRLAELLRLGALEAAGTTRSRRFRFKDPCERLVQQADELNG